jgi:hypothetical protein
MRFAWMRVSATMFLTALLAPPGGAQQKGTPTQTARLAAAIGHCTGTT